MGAQPRGSPFVVSVPWGSIPRPWGMWFSLLQQLRRGIVTHAPLPEHLRRGRLGEQVARRHLETRGLRFLTANYQSRRGEIDLIFRDDNCLVFVEVKTRSSEDWARPAASVGAAKRRRLSLTAEDYLRCLKDRRVPSRFDVVEVLLEGGAVREVRHVINAFPWDPSPVHRFR